MKVLGISAHYHDSAAALLLDGVPVAAAQEERFSRVKHDASFPRQAAHWCLESASLAPGELDAVVFYEKPLHKLDRILTTALDTAPRGYSVFRRAVPAWTREKLWVRSALEREFAGCGEVLFATHHGSHAASGFFPSPFRRAAVLTVDGVGEWATCSYGVGDGNSIELRRELRFPDSLGLLYSAFTAYLGFRVNDGEYKVMGLAPYGEPVHLDVILRELVELDPEGSFRLRMKYFGFRDSLSMTTKAFQRVFGGPPRRPDAPLEPRHLDIAASIQAAAEILMLRLADHVAAATGEDSLCLAGGVALNCVANGRLLREGPFRNLWAQPASGDAGAALGAAYLGHVALGGRIPDKSRGDLMGGALLGPEFRDEEMEAALRQAGVGFRKRSREDLLRSSAQALAEGKVIGWFQGRMEFGPRALGARSILADPRNPEISQRINADVKRRESFRPFAPAVLEERASEYFDLPGKSPYMLLAAPVAENQRRAPPRPSSGLARMRDALSTIPAVTHVDGSARVQTVGPEAQPLFRALLETFCSITGCPVLLNTSFNDRDAPIVCSPRDAVDCFLRTGLDILVLGCCWAEKGALA